MQLALYRAERPEVFEDIIGQKHIVRILQNQIRTGTVSQAYLFAGTHGTGKTSTARILAKAVNCLNAPDAGDGGPANTIFSPGAAADSDMHEADGSGASSGNSLHGADVSGRVPCGHCENCEAIREGRFVDCIELDAASNNGVDDLRTIIDMVKYPPAVGRYKVYIIDEVHMLSQAAENAFLKTLEEPPAHAIFILATTDPQKVRSTIRSRCMQLNFKRVSEEELVAGMERICSKRGIEATRDALVTIASRADGSVRDALSILEQCMAAGDARLDRGLVLEYTGAAGDDFYLALTGAVAAGDTGKALIYIDEILKRGKDARQILKDWLKHYRDLMIVKYVGRSERILGSSSENIARLRAQAETVDLNSLEQAIRLISEYINIGRYSERPRILLETAAVRLAGISGQQPGAATVPVAAAGNRVSGTAGRRAAGGSGKDRSNGISGGGSGSGEIVRAATGGAAPAEEPEPIESITAAPREQAGDPRDMWDKIVRTISNNDRSFVSQLGKHTEGTEYDSGELVITVRPQKMRTANDRLGDISRIAKSLYGSEVFVTLREGEPGGSAAAPVYSAESEQETSRIIDDDVNIGDIAQDIENLFGIKPEITE